MKSDNIPVLVFNPSTSAYQKVGEAAESSSSLDVMKDFLDDICRILQVRAPDFIPESGATVWHAVRKYPFLYAMDTARWNYDGTSGDGWDIDKHDVVPPVEHYPQDDSLCWVVPGFVGDNESLT